MTSLCRHLLPTVQKIVNWVTTADGCVHTADATRVGDLEKALCFNKHSGTCEDEITPNISHVLCVGYVRNGRIISFLHGTGIRIARTSVRRHAAVP